MKLLGIIAVLVAGLTSTAAQAEWMEASGKHFIVYSDTSESKIRDYAEHLERFDAVLRMITSLPETDGAGHNRVTVYVLPGISDVREMARNQNVAGYYTPSVQGSFAFMPMRIANSSIDPMAVMLHEYAHHITLSNSTEAYPRWVAEGMAEFFMTARIRSDGSVVIGAPNMGRKYELGSFNPLSAKDLVENDGRNLPPMNMGELYARGWLLIHYLFLGGERDGQLSKFIELLNSGTPSAEAGEKAFGDLDALSRDLNRYGRRSSLPAVVVKADQIKVGAITVRRMRDGEAAIMKLRMRSAAGVTKEEAPELVPEARRVAALYPRDPFVARTLSEIEFDAQNYDAAEAAADRALSLQPDMVMALVYKGRVEASRARQQTERASRAAHWKLARSWFVKANRSDPDFALPLELYYDSFVQAGEIPPKIAVKGIMRAIQLVPQAPGLHVRVAAELVRERDFATTRAVLAPLAFNPHADTDNNPARAIVELIDSHAQADAIIEAMRKAKWIDGVSEGGE